MRLKCHSQIAQETGVPHPTLCQLVQRGVVPKGDAEVGRRHYYTQDLAMAVEAWLRNEYVPGQRYEGCQINVEEVK